MDDESKSRSGGYSDAQYSPELLNHYIDEAERQACENGMLLFDRSTPSVCQVSVEQGTSVYNIDERILRIDRVDFIETDTTPRKNIVIQTRTHYDQTVPDWRERDFSDLLTCFVDENTIELTGDVDKDGTLYLEVYRLPLQDATSAGRFEIGTRNHSWLMHWVKYLAYNNKDADLYAPQLAEDHKRKFEFRFGNQKSGDTWRYSQKNSPLRSTYNGI
jgi:hypothetical protein